MDKDGHATAGSRQAGDPTTGSMNGQTAGPKNGHTEYGTGGPLIDSSELWCNVEEMKNTVKLEGNLYSPTVMPV